MDGAETQARGRFERATDTGSIAGVPGLAVGSELLFALGGGEGWGPRVRFAVRYYVW